MLTLEGSYYPPAAARRVTGTVALTSDGNILVQVGDEHQSYRAVEVRISQGLGGLPRVFEFPDKAKFECDDCQEIVDWLAVQKLHQGSSFVQRLERRWRWVAFSVALVGTVILWTLFYGIPASAGWLSGLVPNRARLEVGKQTESIIMQMTGGPGNLEDEFYDDIRGRFNSLAAPYSTDDFPITLKFRAGGVIGPNAFAISNGTIVITDEMLKLADDSAAVLGILAHEVGHLHHRHGIQIAIQSSSLPLLVALVTGDLGSGSALLGTIPMSLIQNGYSREHEFEADQFALGVLHDNGMSTQPLADLFDRLLDEAGDVPRWLSTHPANNDRVLFFQEEGVRDPG